MDNEKAVEGLVAEMISPLIERVVTKKLTQILDVAVKHERGKLAAAEARIAELEGYNVGLATESHQQQERIATLQKALEPLSDLSGAWGDHDSDMDEKLVLVQCIDARRAAALLKEKE